MPHPKNLTDGSRDATLPSTKHIVTTPTLLPPLPRTATRPGPLHRHRQKPAKSTTFHIWKVTPIRRALRQTLPKSHISQQFNFGISPSVSINYRHSSQHVRGSSPDIQQPGATNFLHPHPGCVTTVTTFHTWKVRRNFDALHAEDFEAS